MKKLTGRKRRHKRLRKKLVGTPDRPRLNVTKSVDNLYAQIIDDTKNKTLFGLSTNSSEVKSKTKDKGNVKQAILFGEIFASEAKKRGFEKVVFDRSGYLYHGRIKAFAEAARKCGLIF